MSYGKSYLAKEATELHKGLQPFRRLQLKTKGRLEQSLVEHKGIVEALKVGDKTASSVLARNHVLLQGERFNDLMKTKSCGNWAAESPCLGVVHRKCRN